MRLGKRRSAAPAIAQARRLLSRGRLDEHLAFTERAVAEFPSDPELRLAHAVALMTSRPGEARVETLHAVELDQREDPRRLTRAASVLLGLRDLNAARACA